MGNRIVNLFVIAAVGVIIANLVKPGNQTATLVNGVTGLWSTSVSGMLGTEAG